MINSLCTQGELSIGDWICQTLELPVKDGLPGSAIPPGKYLVIQYASPHFNRPMPLIIGIPNRSEIEIHWGNYVDETRGCVLVGKARGDCDVLNSRQAFDELWTKLWAAWVAGEAVSIEVRGGIPLTGSNAGDVANAVHEEGG